MLKKIYKIRKATLLTFILMFSVCFNVIDANAETIPELGKVVDGSELTNEEMSEKIETSLTRGNLLNQGLARITNKGGGVVNMYGATLAHKVCDKLTLKLTLQQYKNGGWVNYITKDTLVAYNTSSLSKSYNESVARGYYYRVKVASVAQDGGATESQAPITDGIWIE